jgi:hypothetical protein
MNILSYLDNEIESFRIRTGDYPSKIICNKSIYDNIFKELESEPTQDNNWIESKDNYRGIDFDIQEIERIKLE